MSEQLDLEAIRARRDAAFAEVVGLCAGTRRWTMSIPVEERYDSDRVIAHALDDVIDLIAELRRSQERAERAVGLVSLLADRLRGLGYINRPLLSESDNPDAPRYLICRDCHAQANEAHLDGCNLGYLLEQAALLEAQEQPQPDTNPHPIDQ